MATNQYVNKIIYDGKVLIDLTGDSVEASKMLSGTTAHDKSGAPITGTCTFDSDTTDANAGAAEILNGKTAYVNKKKISGTMPNNGAVKKTITTKDQVITIPMGYHDGSGSVEIDSTEKAKLIADNIREGVTLMGVVGTMSGSEDMHVQAKEVTPTTSEQIVMPDSEDGFNCLSQVTVAAIPYSETDNDFGGKTVNIAC